jgi:hypothetical protein
MNEEENVDLEKEDDALVNVTNGSNEIDASNKIVVKQVYFDNIQTAVNSLNEFFSSKFTKKDFPMLEEDFQVDQTIVQIVQFLNSVDASWMEDPSHLENAIERLNEVGNELNGGGMEELLNRNDKATLDLFYAFIGYKVLLFIADHFNEFSELMNAIYSMELFTKTSQFRGLIEVFSKPIDINEIASNYPDADEKIFTIDTYVNGLYDNTDQITFPEALTKEEQISRMYEFQDLEGFEVVVDNAVQEAAEINFFEDKKPAHIKYHEKAKKFQTSKQFQSKVNKLFDILRTCETTDDLKNAFSKDLKPTDFTDTVIPFILAKAFNNPKKFSGNKGEELKKYTDSYDSIISKNSGAKRYQNYDIFSTFKTDKEGTIKFLEDFFSLDLVNNENVTITNNTLLTIFNIFDSRIYLDTLFNMIPDKTKDSQKLDEDGWVKKKRAKINQNSRQNNVYQAEEKSDEKAPTTSEIKEYCTRMMKQFGDMSVHDMMYCEHWHTILHDEIATVDDEMFRQHISPIEIDRYIQEAGGTPGDIPDYMKNRIGLSDEEGTAPDVSVTKVNAPEDNTSDFDDIPNDNENKNSIDDLADSLDAKMSTPGDIQQSLGTGYENNPNKQNDGRIVYNITNHYSYTNSFNRDSNNDASKTVTTTNNDLSSGKTTTTNTTNTNSNNDNSSDKTTTTNFDKSSHRIGSGSQTNTNMKSPMNTPSSDPSQSVKLNVQFEPGDDEEPEETENPDENNNSYDNSNDSPDTNATEEETDSVQEFSNGITIEDMFAFLEAAEPLSGTINANTNKKPPKEDLLTKAMDNDRKSLPKMQEAKKGIQKAGNTVKAVLKPVTRTKKELLKVVNDLVKRDEDAVKQELTENPSYRSSLFKALNVATKLGLTAVCFTISGYLGAFVAGIQILKIADKPRLQKEIANECVTEIQIIDEKIKELDGYESRKDPNAKKKKYQLMRQRAKVEQMGIQAIGSKWKSPKTIA